MQRDRFGRPSTSVNFGVTKFTAVEWDVQGDVTYLRGDYDDECLIKKIDGAAGKVTWAFGKWANRATLQYGDDRLFR